MRPIWLQLDNETDRAYLDFEVYRDIGGGGKVYERLAKGWQKIQNHLHGSAKSTIGENGFVLLTITWHKEKLKQWPVTPWKCIEEMLKQQC